jgi:hypothetical protein
MAWKEAVSAAISWADENVLKVSVATPIKGIADTPVGRTRYELSNISLGAMRAAPADISVAIDPPVVTIGAVRFSASVTGFCWSYELDTGLSLVTDRGTGSLSMDSGSASIALEVALPDPQTGEPAKLGLRGVKFNLGKITVKIAQEAMQPTSSFAETIYNWLANFVVEHISQALQSRVMGLVVPACESAVRTANIFLTKHALR